MKRRALLPAFLLLMAGCASDPLPDSYSGPKASLSDLLMPAGSGSVEIFFAAGFNGKPIRNSLGATISASSGLGATIRSRTVRRDVPAEPSVVRIVGVLHYAMPIMAMMFPDYEISGEVAFEPRAGGRYRVQGVLLPTVQSVWIEDADTGEPVTAKLRREMQPSDAFPVPGAAP